MTINDSENIGYDDDEQFKKLLINMHKNMEVESDFDDDDDEEAELSTLQ